MHTRRDAIVSASTALIGTALCWSGSRLLGAQPPAGPGRRAGHAMAYHAGAGAVCLLGGDSAAVQVPGERPWFWTERQWTTRATAETPEVTSLPAAAGDPERKSVLLFGGFTVLGPKRYGPPAGDLWELNAMQRWHRLSGEGPRPAARHHHAAAFDSARGRLVMYGGIDASDKWDRDVWEWDRERWHRVETVTGPGERAHHAMAYDSTRSRVVLRGGSQSDRVRPTDTWEWDGKVWNRAAADGPGPGNGYRMAYDAEHAVTVLFGGDTCLWDRATWTRVTTASAPAARSVHGDGVRSGPQACRLIRGHRGPAEHRRHLGMGRRELEGDRLTLD